MFKGISIKSKKSSKKAQNKMSSNVKTSLESTRGTDLNESFSEYFENLEVDESSSSNINNFSNSPEGI